MSPDAFAVRRARTYLSEIRAARVVNVAERDDCAPGQMRAEIGEGCVTLYCHESTVLAVSAMVARARTGAATQEDAR